MGFHGYGHASCIIGDYCIADCSDGPQVPYHNPDSVSYSHGHYHLHPNRTIVPHHRNDGPIDLSLYCTPTGRGTWSIGGQRAAPPAQTYPPIQATSHFNLMGGHTMIESAMCATSQKTQTRDFSAENAAPGEQALICQATPKVDALEITSAGEYAKHDRSNDDGERAELEKKAAALLKIVGEMGPSPVYQEHSNACANVARITGVGKVSEFSKSMASSQEAIDHRRGMRGIDTTVSTAHSIARHRSRISDTSDPHSGSTAFSRDGSSGPSYEDSFDAPNSGCESEDETHEAGKYAV